MKYALIVSMGLFAAYCNAAEGSTQNNESSRMPITLIGGTRTFTSHIDLLNMDSTRTSMVEHLKFRLPCIWTLLDCRSSTASTGIRRKIRNADEIHTRVEAYNEKHKKHPIVRDPHYYLVWQDANGAIKGRFLGREQDALSEAPDYRDLRCMLTEQKLSARALAAMRQYMEGKLYNEAAAWYTRVMQFTRNGEDLVAADDPSREDWSHTLYHVGYGCFYDGEYTKALELGRESLRFKHCSEMNIEIEGLLCRSYVALRQWDRAIVFAGNLTHCRTKNDAGVLKALAEAYEHKGLLEAALFTCAQVIDLKQVYPGPIDEEYVPACLHFMYYYNQYALKRKDLLRQLLPEVKNRLVIAATAVKKIPEALARINKDSEERLLKFEKDLQAYQARYPRRYEIALQEANLLLTQLGQEPNSSAAQNPREFAIAAPEATALPAPSTSSVE